MPRATVDTETHLTVNLKTLPEGYVVLKRMSFGEKLDRRAMSASMEVPMGRSGGRNRKGRQDDARATMALMQAKVTLFEFAHCIVEHNLEDERGRTLDLSSESDKKLDPRIGDEIDQAISELNNFEDEDQDNPEGNSEAG
jgi:hypothetical protein